MMLKKVLLIIEPHHKDDEKLKTNMAEIIDAGLAIASYEHEVHLWFQGESLKFLTAEKHLSILDGLELYGIHHLWLSKENSIANALLKYSCNYIESKEQSKFKEQFDYILRFD